MILGSRLQMCFWPSWHNIHAALKPLATRATFCQTWHQRQTEVNQIPYGWTHEVGAPGSPSSPESIIPVVSHLQAYTHTKSCSIVNEGWLVIRRACFFIRGYNFTTAGICIWEPDGWNSSAGKANQSMEQPVLSCNRKQVLLNEVSIHPGILSSRVGHERC